MERRQKNFLACFVVHCEFYAQDVETVVFVIWVFVIF